MSASRAKFRWLLAGCTAGLLTILAGTGFGSAADAPAPAAQSARAVFAGGCFWCMEPPFDAVPGVIATVSGYTGGMRENPSYEQVSEGGTGHFEAIEVTYDPARVSYAQLLDVFWRNVDPLDDGGQFCDRGSQYGTAIFYANEDEKAAALKSREAVAEKLVIKGPIVTPLLPAKEFYPAEEYHQDYYQKNPLRYKYYRYACERDQRLKEVWGEAKQP
ncbi:MAG TPA: peptide-methionine (S)-S-oxide reductase MsrA [Defluviicoccus sp.]|nr:peptide-methionine (S)-S-oxide reductase MsrA [Defluviicoccus sp.]